jgi:lipopolysaccharide transport system permease protein
VNAEAVVIEPRPLRRLIPLRELWRCRELLGLLAWRDVRVRYRQTVIGVAWALGEPVISVLMFTLLFHSVAGLRSGGTPYPLFCFVGMLAWGHFARLVRYSSTSLAANAGLLGKAYFPRLALPGASLLAGMLDLLCGLGAYVLLASWCGVPPTAACLTLPLWLLIATVQATGVGLAFSTLNVRFRDVTHALPFLLQIWMFATPVAYPADALPPQWQWLAFANPMAGVVDATRWALLPGHVPHPEWIAASALWSVGLLLFGLIAFRIGERGMADVV